MCHNVHVCNVFLQVGRFEVNLISPDSKTVVLEKNFKDISSCCQVCLFLLAVAVTLKASLLCLCCSPGQAIGMLQLCMSLKTIALMSRKDMQLCITFIGI